MEKSNLKLSFVLFMIIGACICTHSTTHLLKKLNKLTKKNAHRQNANIVSLDPKVISDIYKNFYLQPSGKIRDALLSPVQSAISRFIGSNYEFKGKKRPFIVVINNDMTDKREYLTLETIRTESGMVFSKPPLGTTINAGGAQIHYFADLSSDRTNSVSGWVTYRRASGQKLGVGFLHHSSGAVKCGAGWNDGQQIFRVLESYTYKGVVRRDQSGIPIFHIYPSLI